MKMDLDTVRGFFRLSPFMVDLGIEPFKVEPGRVSTALQLAQRHLQHTGQVHAGVTAAIADHTMGAAAQTMAAEGFWVLTAEFKTSLLRAAQGQRLICEAHVLKPGRQVSFTEAEVFVESDGQRILVAKASATMALVAAQR
jgi:uncharacterized protein (TIGR00369 family)